MTARQTPLFDEHVNSGARMVDFAGWQMPIQYKGIIEEHDAVRNAVGVFDVSHMGEIEIAGAKAFEFCQTMTCNDVSKLKPGKIQYSAILNEQGGVIDDCTVYQMAEQHYFIVVNASRKDEVMKWFLEHKIPQVEINDLSDDYGLIAIQGKKSQVVLSHVLGRELDSLKYYEFMITQFSHNVLIVSRTGYSGEDGFELYVPTKKTKELWTALMEQGKEFGIQAIGLGARDTLRLEMGYLLYGQDMNTSVSALQAGLSWIIKFDKGNFIGKAALENEKKKGIEKRIRGFVMEEKSIPRSHYEIFKDGKKVGEVTSGTFSPTLKKGIGLGLIDSSFEIGDEIQVQVRKNLVPARIVKPPFVAGSVRK